MNMKGDAEKPKYEWVAVEHRDADGNRVFPREVLASTYLRRYEEVPDGTEIKVLVLLNYKPKSLMLVERKIYEIHYLSVHGWRRSGQIAVEMEGWRQHEGDWFNAMRGAKLEIPNPDLPRSKRQQLDYIISATSFQRKNVTLVGEDGGKTEIQMYEGTLDITETWKSACRRQAAEILNAGFRYFLLPVVSALVAGLAVWWIDRPPDPGGHEPASRGVPAEQPVQAGMEDTVPKSSDAADNEPRPTEPAREADADEQDLTDTTASDDIATEVSAHDEVGGQQELDTNAINLGVERNIPELPTPADAEQGQVYERRAADNE